MSQLPFLPQKKYQIAQKVLEPRALSVEKDSFQKALSFLGDIDVFEIKSWDDPSLYQADLLVIDASHVRQEHLQVWLQNLVKTMQLAGKIWIPGLIFASVSLEQIAPMLSLGIHQNWYFDLVDVGEINTLPLRIANLLKIHDHLREIDRYQKTLENLTDQVSAMEKLVQKIGASKDNG